MAIPDYQTLMLPILKIAGDGQEHRISDVVDQLARDFQLTEEEQCLPKARRVSTTSTSHNSPSSFSFENAIACRGLRYPQMLPKSLSRRCRHKLRMKLLRNTVNQIETALRKELLDR